MFTDLLRVKSQLRRHVGSRILLFNDSGHQGFPISPFLMLQDATDQPDRSRNRLTWYHNEPGILGERPHAAHL